MINTSRRPLYCITSQPQIILMNGTPSKNRGDKRVSFNEKVISIRIPRASPQEKPVLYYQREEIEQFRQEKRDAKERRRGVYSGVLLQLLENYIQWTSSCHSWDPKKYLQKLNDSPLNLVLNHHKKWSRPFPPPRAACT
mmetsp:Transcript_4209/g.4893  ORF Transcript_4209/g.4893 Transcript_4209/m.4893 type:complete len:139 (-) Transcript_4209:302-718(-)